MSRFLATLHCDARVQWRNGFYYVGLFIVLVAGLLLRQLPRLWLDALLPAFLVSSLSFTTYYFMAALVLLEKDEHALEGLVVTPLRPADYLAAKSVSLAGLAVAESLLIVLLARGASSGLVWLVLGVALLGTTFTLFGFVAVARYDSLNAYLFPSVGFVALLTLPLVGSVGLWDTPLFYLHPLQPALVLIRAAFTPADAGALAYGVGGALVWVGISFYGARRSFYRFVIRRAGD